jgi:hypothetical protein
MTVAALELTDIFRIHGAATTSRRSDIRSLLTKRKR